MMIKIETDKILSNLTKREVATKLENGYNYIRTINRNKVELVNGLGATTSINLSDIENFTWYSRV